MGSVVMRLSRQFSGYEKMEGLAEKSKPKSSAAYRTLKFLLQHSPSATPTLSFRPLSPPPPPMSMAQPPPRTASPPSYASTQFETSHLSAYLLITTTGLSKHGGISWVPHPFVISAKALFWVNTQAPADVSDCSNRNYSKYYVVVVQYTARFNAETVKNFLYTLNDGKISKKRFNMRLAPEETSMKLTGFEHNGVTCIGMKTGIPVILDEPIVKLNPDFFWLAGGEVDLKIGIRTPEFIDYVKPFIINCSGS
ncbi:hypothetical protein OROMI_020646 [Orobanche minor]